MSQHLEHVLIQPRAPRALACAGVLAVGAIAIYKGWSHSPGLQYFTWTMALACVLWAWRFWRVRVVLERDVSIENIMQTICLSWSQVDGFELDRHGGVRVRLFDGRTRRITAFGRPPRKDIFGWRHNNEAAVVALQGVLLSQRAQRLDETRRGFG